MNCSRRVSYADPLGSVHFNDGFYERRLDVDAQSHFGRLLSQPFWRQLVCSGVVANAELHAGTLRAPAVGVPIFPWEWVASQLHRAAQATLSASEAAAEDGWTLKDAQARNVVFRHTTPVFVDHGSFEPMTGEITWRARGQFDRQFVLPMLAELHRDIAISDIARCYLDGLPPAVAARILGWRSWTSWAALEACALPTLIESRKPAAAPIGNKLRPLSAGRDVTHATYLAGLRRARRTVDGIARDLAARRSSHWAGYDDGQSHYGVGEFERKRDWVAERLNAAAPSRIVDVGANTGTFTMLAAERGAEVLALDSDRAALDTLFARADRLGLRVGVALADLCNPPGAAGWASAEFPSFLERFAEHGDVVLALAVSHHVAARGYDYESLVNMLSRLTRQHLIIEFVDPSDEMFAGLLSVRRLDAERFGWDAFEAAFLRRYRIVSDMSLKQGRRRLLHGVLVHGQH